MLCDSAGGEEASVGLVFTWVCVEGEGVCVCVFVRAYMCGGVEATG